MGELSQLNWSSTVQNRVPPTEGVLDSPTRCIEVNVKWAGFLAGVIERLAYHDVWRGDDNTVRVAIDKIEQILLQLGSDCPTAGGATDYTLHSDITLTADAASYNLTGLESLSGLDLIIDLMLATTDGAQRDLKLQSNGITTSTYTRTDTIFQSSTVYSTGTTAYYNISRGLVASATPQRRYTWIQLNIPDWKATDRYIKFHHQAIVSGRHSLGRCDTTDATALSSLLLYASAGDIKAGSKIRIYSRG